MSNDRWQDIIEIVSVCSIVALVSVSPQALAQSESGRGRILFVSEWERNSEIYVMDADGSNVRQLTQHEAVDARPVWSSDGTKIAFASRRDGNQEIYVMDADGGNVERLTSNDHYDGHPDW